MWGMDVIGSISPKASNGHRFIFGVIDYFTKWVEAASYASVTKSAVSWFLKKEIICRYGMPERIISDNASNLNNSTIVEVCSQFKIKHHNLSPYRPKRNRAVEAADKNIKKIVGKMTETYKDWHEKLPFALYAYRTSVRTSTGVTPFSLVYGMEVVLPIEVEIPSLRVLSEIKLDEAEWIQARYNQLNLIEEKRLRATCYSQMYQKRIIRAYDKKRVSRGGPCTEKDPSHTKGFQRKMDVKLGRTICGEESFLWRCTDSDRNGWKKLTQSCELRFSQKLFCLKRRRAKLKPAKDTLRLLKKKEERPR
ncbi:RNA-directed DNA polymerase [Gossypium australe]|uniref:RNA-directed DNA polymerase n=1 Tax=Gossypium australe TaxID=47621 RepID=A0A5B6UZS4_9ROSI|nr:RNA-directed DNA polymerase [Gossypium australe]